MRPRPIELSLPSPTRRLLSEGTRELWVKDDGAIHVDYGGNKPRKLAYLLEAARKRGAHRLVTIGAAGSHHVLATGILGRKLELQTTALTLPRHYTEHAEQTLLRSVSVGVEHLNVFEVRNLPKILSDAFRSDAVWIPPGGSNALGSLGYLEALFELEGQIRDGELPEPDFIFVALGSGGTAAGLLAGLVSSTLRTRLVAVPVLRLPAPRLLVEGLAASTLRLSGRRVPKDLGKRLVIDGRWLGKGYGVPTLAGETAVEIAANCGLSLESTYTGKTFAAALGWLSGSEDRGNVSTRPRARGATAPRHGPTGESTRALFWSTISTTKDSPTPLLTTTLPPALRSLLRTE